MALIVGAILSRGYKMSNLLKQVDQQDAINICKAIYSALNGKGFYPALTGGSLYKEGLRKDVDIVIYRNRDNDEMDMEVVAELLKPYGFGEFKFYGWCTKCVFAGIIAIDLFNPEALDGDYPEDDSENF